MVKNKCGFVGVGAYGGNQVRPFYKESYPSLFINTALTDLNSLTDVEEKYKYHVPGSEGCNKDRKKSKELFRQEIDNIINEIKEKMPGIEYLFIVASAGGGCGSGVLAALKQVAMEEMDLKGCIIITVLPDTKTESIKALINSYETLAEIEQLNEYAGATFILDNDKSTNKMRINEMFFCYLDSLLTSENSSTYVNKRHQIIKDFANGDKDLSKYGEKTYDELMSENDSNIQNALKNANSYKQQILSIVKTQSQKEQDALFKVIDARKEALKKKRDYYEYDKKIKSSTKEINLLQQQIDALDDVGDAETRAQKARLEAQLKDAQDDLDDTVRDHVYDLQVDGLDDLEDQLKEDFEKWSNELSGNLDKMSQAINDAINNSGASAADAMNTLAEVLKQFNITPDQLGISASNLSAGNIKKYDKGTKHIGHNSVVMTNENGREIIVTDKGWLTDVHTGDEIISTADTAALGEVAEKYRNNELLPNIRIPEIKSDGDRNVVYNYTNNSPVTIQGDLVRDTLPDLKTILKESSKYTQNEMRKNLRRT